MALRSFKTDESFLTKLAIGAVGARKVIADLQSRGLHPIELERGSSGFKIWKSIRIKRIRVPDILLLNSGIRVESRAKTKLALSMSHSIADETRGWDFGLKDDDYIAFVVCHRSGDEPIDWEADELVQYVRTVDLRKAFKKKRVIQEKPKGAGEGFESRLTWPCAVASSAGQVSLISDQRLQFKKATNGRTVTLRLVKKGIELSPLVQQGNTFQRNTILASVVPVHSTVQSRSVNQVTYYGDLLNSKSLADRYTAAKAFSYIKPFNAESLVSRLSDEDEHIYVRLESAATLARHGNRRGFDFINSVLDGEYLDKKLEAIITLGEIPSPTSCSLLCQVLKNTNQCEEIRAGAAWALGELNSKDCIPDLVSTFNDMRAEIRVEAARALRKICNTHTSPILDLFKSASQAERPGIAWALSQCDKWQVDDILSRIDKKNLDMRQWAACIFGHAAEERIVSDFEKVKREDPEIYFATTLLWKLLSSWVYGLKEY